MAANDLLAQMAGGTVGAVMGAGATQFLTSRAHRRDRRRLEQEKTEARLVTIERTLFVLQQNLTDNRKDRP